MGDPDFNLKTGSALPAIIEPIAAGSTALWRCPVCRRVLGVIGDGRLVVQHYRRTIVVWATTAEQTCHGCGTISRLPDELPLAS